MTSYQPFLIRLLVLLLLPCSLIPVALASSGSQDAYGSQGAYSPFIPTVLVGVPSADLTSSMAVSNSSDMGFFGSFEEGTSTLPLNGSTVVSSLNQSLMWSKMGRFLSNWSYFAGEMVLYTKEVKVVFLSVSSDINSWSQAVMEWSSLAEKIPALGVNAAGESSSSTAAMSPGTPELVALASAFEESSRNAAAQVEHMETQATQLTSAKYTQHLPQHLSVMAADVASLTDRIASVATYLAARASVWHANVDMAPSSLPYVNASAIDTASLSDRASELADHSEVVSEFVLEWSQYATSIVDWSADWAQYIQEQAKFLGVSEVIA